jgi:hypothetical protein
VKSRGLLCGREKGLKCSRVAGVLALVVNAERIRKLNPHLTRFSWFVIKCSPINNDVMIYTTLFVIIIMLRNTNK